MPSERHTFALGKERPPDALWDKAWTIATGTAGYGIGQRSHVSGGTSHRDLDVVKLARVKDQHVRMALRLQAAFGLRREEAIKFAPARADRGDHIAVKASTAKGLEGAGGGRPAP